jgi:hypothetical protein
MTLDPYTEVNGWPFTATSADVRQRHGPPDRQTCNGVGLLELDYGTSVFRFQQGGRLEEVTARAPVLHLPGGVAVPFASLAAFLRRHDAGTFRVGGFFVSPTFGLAFDPSDSNWVTALAAHALPEWRKLEATRTA